MNTAEDLIHLTPAAFLVFLERLGVCVRLDLDGRLRCRAPRGVLTAGIQAQIMHYKADLVELLIRPRRRKTCTRSGLHMFLRMADGRRCVRCNRREEAESPCT